MLLQLLLAQTSPKTSVRRHMRALALLRHDDAFPFQFQIGPLDRDHADLKVRSKLPNGGNWLALGPIAHSDTLPHLLHDLEVHRTLIRLRNRKRTVHVGILSIYS